jgi:hypothetical protein
LCDQVDEVLSEPFPDILLIWIGHNDVDWRGRTDSLTSKALLELSNAFVQEYEFQLRRLLDGALAKGSRSTLVVFGLVNFKLFFDARGKAEAMRSANNSLFPFLEAGYKSFVSMKPEYRGGMIELATHFKQARGDVQQDWRAIAGNGSPPCLFRRHVTHGDGWRN